MKTKQKKLYLLTLLLALVAMLGIWKMEILEEKKETKPKNKVFYDSGLVKDEVVFLQKFIPRYSKLEAISIMVDKKEAGEGGKLIASVYDFDKKIVLQKEIPLSEIQNRRYYNLPLNLTLNLDEEYYYELKVKECSGAGIRVMFGEQADIGLSENIGLFYDNQEFVEYSSAVSYHYLKRVSADKFLVYYAYIVTIVGLCYTILKVFTIEGNKFERDN